MSKTDGTVPVRARNESPEIQAGDAAQRSLAGIRVLDLTQVLAGPYCTRLMADGGADVIKIESPAGDPSRHLPPRIGDAHSGYFAWLNCGKRSVVADLHTSEGRELVRELARQSDVVVENMRPGSLSAKGLGYDQLSALNPGLIMCSISAFGATGSMAGRAGQGIIAEGMAGFIDMNGEPGRDPLPLSAALADISAGTHAYAAVMTALFRRVRTSGTGEYIDVSLFDCALPFHETAFQEVEVGGPEVDPTRNGREHRQVVPYGVYRGPDAPFVLAAGTARLWTRLDTLMSTLIDRPTADLSSNDRRVKHRDVVRERVERWAGTFGSTDDVIGELVGAGIPAGPVARVRDVADGALARSRHSFVEVPDPVRGSIRVLNTPFRMTSVRNGPRSGPPRLGQHTDEVKSNMQEIRHDRL